MRSKLPKSLHSICGKAVTRHVIDACRAAGVTRIIVVVGHEAEVVKSGLGSDVEYALQVHQRGTGDAVIAAKENLKDWCGPILVLAGDAPLIRPETICQLIAMQAGGASLAMATAVLDNPTGYGRILRDDDDNILRIVEEKDASEAEKRIKEWNPSVYVFDPVQLWDALDMVQPNNSQGEFYLTDTVRIISEKGGMIRSYTVPCATETLGINTKLELAEAAAIMRSAILKNHMLAGVTIVDPANTYIDAAVSIEQDTTILPGSLLCGHTSIGPDCVIGPAANITDSTVGAGCYIVSSQIVQSVLENRVKVGPFANLRPGTHLCDAVKIGDFVELKNARLEEAVSVSHLSYLGDAHVGEHTNIGAGTITCNYDGFDKHRTEIGARAFVGSHSTLIAPIHVGNDVIVAAGTTLPAGVSVPDDSLAISREAHSIKPEWARKYRESKRKRSQI